MAPPTTFCPISHLPRSCVSPTSLLATGKVRVSTVTRVHADHTIGYAAPENLQNYAVYLESRIRAYRDLKHDAVRVQAESNRDMRNSQSIEEDGYRGNSKRGKSAQSAAPSRSKTIMGRKLRSMTVEKGLLRETRAVHRMIDALVECRVRYSRFPSFVNLIGDLVLPR